MRPMALMALLSSSMLLAGVLGCGATPQDVAEIKSSQKDILAKVEALSGEVQKLAARPAPAAAPNQPDPNRVVNIPVGDSPTKGKKDAAITIVEFSDYQCPFCARVEPLLNEALEKFPDKVRLAFKQFPLTSIHADAMPASKAALAAGKQGKYWEMHDLLFANARALKPENLKAYAEQLGLDMAQWDKDFNSPEIQNQINEEMRQAREAGVRGTPTIFVGGRLLQNRSIEGIAALVSAAEKG